MLQNQWKLRLKYFLELFLNDHDRKNVDFIENLKSFLSLFFLKTDFHQWKKVGCSFFRCCNFLNVNET